MGSDEAWGMARRDDVYNSNAAVCPVSSTVPGTKQMLKKYLLNQFEDEIFWVINLFLLSLNKLLFISLNICHRYYFSKADFFFLDDYKLQPIRSLF